MTIAAVLPTRGRPAQAARLVARCRETSTAEIVLVIDDDDPNAHAYATIPGAHLLVTNSRGFAAGINFGMRYALDQLNAEAVLWLGDDVWPRTERWAEGLLSALDGRPGIAYGDDLFQRDRLPTHPLVTADILRAVGYFAPPGFVHLYVDNVWRDLGQETGTLLYVPSVVIEHRHPAAKKATVDDGYRRTNSPRAYIRDGEAYIAWQESGEYDRAVLAIQHVLRSQS